MQSLLNATCWSLHYDWDSLSIFPFPYLFFTPDEETMLPFLYCGFYSAPSTFSISLDLSPRPVLVHLYFPSKVMIEALFFSLSWNLLSQLSIFLILLFKTTIYNIFTSVHQRWPVHLIRKAVQRHCFLQWVWAEQFQIKGVPSGPGSGT